MTNDFAFGFDDGDGDGDGDGAVERGAGVDSDEAGRERADALAGVADRVAVGALLVHAATTSTAPTNEPVAVTTRANIRRA